MDGGAGRIVLEIHLQDSAALLRVCPRCECRRAECQRPDGAEQACEWPHVVSFPFIQSFAGMMAWQPGDVDCVIAESSQFVSGASHGESWPSASPVCADTFPPSRHTRPRAGI